MLKVLFLQVMALNSLNWKYLECLRKEQIPWAVTQTYLKLCFTKRNCVVFGQVFSELLEVCGADAQNMGHFPFIWASYGPAFRKVR